MRKVISIIIVLFYSTSLYAEVYTYYLRSGFYVQIRTLEDTTLRDLLDDMNKPFVLFFLTTNSNSEIINDLGFTLYGLDDNNQITLIELTLHDFSSFLSILPTQNPILLSEDSMSLLDYDSVIQVNYVVTNFSELFVYTNSINPLPVMENVGFYDHSQYTSNCASLLQTDHYTVPATINEGMQNLSCKYGCTYEPTSFSDSAYHNLKSHKKDKEKIMYYINSGIKCPFCVVEQTFRSFACFTSHIRWKHEHHNYKDFLDRMK